MVTSIPNFISPQTKRRKKKQSFYRSFVNARATVITWAMYNVHFIILLSLVSPLLFFSFTTWILGMIAVGPFYMLFCACTNYYWSCPNFRHCMVTEDVKRHFSGKIIATTKLEEDKQYVLGFHPHGILPLTAMWCHNSEEWRDKVSNHELVTLAANHAFVIPIMRELMMAAGSKPATRKNFVNMLEAKKSVVLVPGGVAELMLTDSKAKEIHLVTGHKGFIRLAISHGVNLVPMFSFGEWEVMDIMWPSVQRYCRRILGIPFPLFVGRALYIPRQQPITVVVGAPIEVKRREIPTEEEVDDLHRKYFTALHKIFEDHKAEAGYGSHKLKFLDFQIQTSDS